MFKVLIVEDDPMVTMINEQYIEKNRDFKVVGKCSNGEDAISFLEKQTADLVILDVYMPHMDGLTTLKEIRDRNFPVSVIMVTAANDISTFEAAMRLGAVDYLVKPFDFARFQLALEKYASKTQVLNEGSTLNQSSIDQIVGTQHTNTESLPKGIQEQTKSSILECLASSAGWMTGDEIASGCGLSAVTVRRYMNHLAQTGEVTSRMNYDTGGRPCMMYSLRR